MEHGFLAYLDQDERPIGPRVPVTFDVVVTDTSVEVHTDPPSVSMPRIAGGVTMFGLGLFDLSEGCVAYWLLAPEQRPPDEPLSLALRPVAFR